MLSGNVYQHLAPSPALRSRRSLRSLARYARSTILKIFLYVVDAKSRSKISEILSKLLPKSIQNPSKFALQSIQNRIQIDLWLQKLARSPPESYQNRASTSTSLCKRFGSVLGRKTSKKKPGVSIEREARLKGKLAGIRWNIA